MTGLTRRFVLASSLFLCPAAFTLASCANRSSEPASDLDILTRFIALLLPLDQADKYVYADIAASIIKSSYSDPVLIQAVSDAIDTLRDCDWMAQAEAEQIGVLKALESESWFLGLAAQAKGMFFKRQDIWNVISYDGSSLESGGYKNMDLDDMSWLAGKTSP